ncbi:replicative DNA helicase [Deinococcus gobiensis]|uniref:DnaB-like helicase n=1 Tax=Deinococcus gobiensis (strain DSM 21396 / JCM 16679 / CGMCC 1.7299 / I-0) TaxID=745776 RepID=H8GX83_DEIGI|nr:DnaB-like helicase C-terminal domain-containing protein [Deinococcus gobiensis]AFD25812.1 DnaB-like helicase [Deinococcus gobiensis I-0]
MNYENPHQLELAIIGQVLNDSAALQIPEIRALKPEHLRHHSGVWSAILDIAAAGGDPSLTALASHVGRVGWPTYIGVADLPSLTAYSAPLRELPAAAQVILGAYRRDRAMHAGGDLQRSLADPEADHLAAITGAQASLTELIGLAPRDSTRSIADNVGPALERLLNPRAYRGVTTGIPGWDSVLGGWKPGTLNILAARPSMGKSLLMGQLAQAAAQGDAKGPARALMFTLEDSPETLQMRVLCRMAGVAIDHDREPTREEAQRLRNKEEAFERFRPYWLVDEEHTLDGIISACWRQHAIAPLGLVLIDQLSHISADAPRTRADNRNQVYGYIAKTLKREVAKRLGVPVILASQLSRDVVRRADNRPDLTDLRDSGELEQDADTVTFIHRPEYYDKNDSPGTAELLVRKNRNGATKDVTVWASMRKFKFWQDAL